MIQKIYESQPFLSQINNHENKLEGLNNILELSLKSDSKEDKENSNSDAIVACVVIICAVAAATFWVSSL